MEPLKKGKQDVLAVFRARELLTAIVLIVSLTITYGLWTAASQTAELSLRTAFDFRVRESNNRIKQRVTSYEQILRATTGLFSSNATVTREIFHNFVTALQLAEYYPGILGIGFAKLINPAEKERHVAAVRDEGFLNYQIWPEGKRDMVTSIIYLEPFSGRNLRAFGFDMFSEPVRRAAMEQARDTGAAAVSGKVILVQEAGSQVQSGFLIYLPIYRHGARSDTLEQRRRNLVGWVYAPLRMGDFMHGVDGEQAGDLDIEIYDQTEISERSKMYDAELGVSALDPKHRLRSVAWINIRNHTWTVVTSALPGFESKTQSDRPQLILQAGISISLLISLLVWLILDDRARTLQAAEQALQLALYDALTGLPNRKLLDERIMQALTHAKRSKGHVALLFIDLNRFKPVNDTYGHAYGDLLLKDVAKRLRSCMRESDTAARLGGDEFVAVLSDIEGESAVRTVADKILARLNEPFDIAGHTFEISASIGAAIHPGDGTDTKTLMKSADLAMYKAKNSGRSNVKFARSAAKDPAH